MSSSTAASVFTGMLLSLLAIPFCYAYCENKDFCCKSLAKGNYVKAIEECTRRIEKNPGAELAVDYNRRGIAYAFAKRYDEAIGDFTRAIELDPPKKASAYHNRGIAFRDKGQLDKAIEDFTRVIELDPGSIKAYTNRGNAFKNTGQYDRALEDYSRIIELDPGYAAAYYKKAGIYSLAGNAVEACKLLERARERGYDDWIRIRRDGDFDALRQSPCYKALLEGKE